MKKFSILFAAILFAVSSNAQEVPNSGFENWTDEHTATSWNSTFDAEVPFNYNGMDVTVHINYDAARRSDDSHSGNYAVQLVTQQANVTANIYGMEMTVYTLTLPGMIQLGELDTENLSNIDLENVGDFGDFNLTDYVYGGIPCTQIPTKLKAWVKFQAVNDTMRLGVLATRWNNGQREVVARGDFLSSQAYSQYVQLEAPVNVLIEGATPDTLNIFFCSAGASCDSATTLWVDDMELVFGENNIYEVSSLPMFQVGPNPSSDKIYVNTLENSEYAVALFDMNGRMVYEATGLEGKSTIDVSCFAKGVYTLKVKQNGKVNAKKVMVQ
ncbi:MAG: T9SS type A sorting domain-containing protein [Bacteroidales bacterium]|nr:T9SS type A sorting domain-containing protein [Bacteroidales bacterium]